MFHICDVFYNDPKKIIIDKVFIKSINKNKIEIIMTSRLKKKTAVLMLRKSYDYPGVENTYDIINTLLKTKYNKEFVTKLVYKTNNFKLIVLKSKLNDFYL